MKVEQVNTSDLNCYLSSAVNQGYVVISIVPYRIETQGYVQFVRQYTVIMRKTI